MKTLASAALVGLHKQVSLLPVPTPGSQHSMLRMDWGHATKGSRGALARRVKYAKLPAPALLAVHPKRSASPRAQASWNRTPPNLCQLEGCVRSLELGASPHTNWTARSCGTPPVLDECCKRGTYPLGLLLGLLLGLVLAAALWSLHGWPQKHTRKSKTAGLRSSPHVPPQPRCWLEKRWYAPNGRAHPQDMVRSSVHCGLGENFAPYTACQHGGVEPTGKGHAAEGVRGERG